MVEEKIEFLAKYKDWIAVKKLSINEKTKPKDVVYILGAIWGTIEDKLGDFLKDAGADMDKIDSQTERIAGELGKRVRVVLRGFDDPLVKEVAKIYVIRKAMEEADWPIEINTKKLRKLLRKK